MNSPETEQNAHKMREELKASLDGELSLWRKWRVHFHLLGCASCREEREWLGRLGSDMKRLERAEPRPELRSKILASLPDLPPSGQPIRGGLPTRPAMPRYASAFASLAVVTILLSGGVFAYRRYFVPGASTLPLQVAVHPMPIPRTESPTPDPKAETSTMPSSVEPTPQRDALSDEASRLVAEEERQERIAQARKKREDRLKKRQLASKNKSNEETPSLQLASTERGATGVVLLTQFRETVTKFDGKLTSLPKTQKQSSKDREVLVRVPADRVEAFLAALDHVGTLTKADISEKKTSASSSAPTDVLPTRKMPTPLPSAMLNPRQEDAIATRLGHSAAILDTPRVLVVQPDRSGYVSLRVRLHL